MPKRTDISSILITGAGAPMVSLLAFALSVLTPAAAAAQETYVSMLPAEPKVVTDVGIGTPCGGTGYYFAGIMFQEWGGSEGVRLAEQAASTYATPSGLVKLPNGAHFLRGTEVRDFEGLKRFLGSLGDYWEAKIAVVGIPTDKRFAPAPEQLATWREFFIHEILELGAETCSAEN